MAIGKWAMRISGLLFLVIGVGAIVVVLVPGFNEWIAERSTTGGHTDGSGVVIRSSNTGPASPDDVKQVGWILGLTFLPCALLFFWIGQWFKSMESSVPTLRQTLAQAGQAMQQSAAMYQQVVPGEGGGPASGVTTGVSTPTDTPTPTDTVPPKSRPPSSPMPEPAIEPPDPTAGGIIS